MVRQLFGLFLMFASGVALAQTADPHGVPLQLQLRGEPAPLQCLQTARVPSEVSNHLIATRCTPVGGLQMFSLFAVEGGGYTIVNTESGGCLSVGGAQAWPDAPVLDWACTGRPNQRWEVAYWSGLPGRMMIRNWENKLCLTMDDGIARQSECDFANFTGPIWNAARQDQRAGQSFAALRTQSGMCLTSDSPVLGAMCGDARTVFRFTKLDAAATTFRIRRDATSCLSDRGGWPGTFVDCSSPDAGAWRIVQKLWSPGSLPAPDGMNRWFLQSVATGQCLGGYPFMATQNQAMYVMACVDQPNMIWSFTQL